MSLRRDPFERADFNSNTYFDWMVDHVPQMYEMQAVVAGAIGDFAKFPPRQKPASFNLDAVLAQVNSRTAKAVQREEPFIPGRNGPGMEGSLTHEERRYRRAGNRLLRNPPLSAAHRRSRRLSRSLGRCASPHRIHALLAVGTLPQRSQHPRRRLRHHASRALRRPLAKGQSHRHRRQRQEHRIHAGSEAQVRSPQPRGASTPDRTRRRTRPNLRVHRLNGRASPFSRPRRRLTSAARRARAERARST